VLGALAINILFVRKAKVGRLDIGDLRVGRLLVRRTVSDVEPDWGF